MLSNHIGLRKQEKRETSLRVMVGSEGFKKLQNTVMMKARVHQKQFANPADSKSGSRVAQYLKVSGELVQQSTAYVSLFSLHM